MTEITTHRSSALAIPEDEAIMVLQSSLYPGAAVDSVRMVLSYCRAQGLDPFQKPVHIVPMWDRQTNRMRDVIMPGVNLYRVQASRSGQFAGISEPDFGPEITKSLDGQDISFPEWCKVTVKRQLSSGHVADFTAVEYWMENYAAKGGKDKSIAPNAMWTKRPRGQIAKCAAAQALRSAFPEIAGQYTAEEMEGKELAHEDVEVVGQPKNFGITSERAKMLRNVAAEALQKFNEGDEYAAYESVSFIDDNEEKLALWSILKPHSALRSSIKRQAQEEAAREAQLKQSAAS